MSRPGLQFADRFVDQQEDCRDGKPERTGKEQRRGTEGLEDDAGQDRSDRDHPLGTDADDAVDFAELVLLHRAHDGGADRDIDKGHEQACHESAQAEQRQEDIQGIAPVHQQPVGHRKEDHDCGVNTESDGHRMAAFFRRLPGAEDRRADQGAEAEAHRDDGGPELRSQQTIEQIRRCCGDIRLDEEGERVPFTICDYDREQGTITLAIQAVGATTMRLEKMNEGDAIHDMVGPLGKATHLDVEKILLVAGGIGVAVLYPQAKYLKSIGKKVVCVMGARDVSLLAYLDEMKEVCDELFVTTDNGSFGEKGFVTTVVSRIFEADKNAYDMVFAVGPLPMMRAVCNVTRELGVKTIVSMNPVMVDGTGMCGGCRLTVGGVTKYACVDGPEFDGHEVDFDEVMNRNSYYREIEQKHVCNLTGEVR